MLQAIDIYKSYKYPILNGLTLQLEKGSIAGIAGKNGSGKSTLLNILASILKSDSGSVTIDGVDIFSRSFPLNNKIGFLPQENFLFEDLTVQDNLGFWASALNKKYTSLYFGENDLKKKAKHLSGGMKKKLCLEIALINSPEFIIMDEPTAALDIVFQEQILYLMTELKNQGKGILFTTHYSDELKLCDTIHLLHKGQFIYQGTPLNFSLESEFRDKLFKTIGRDD